MFTSPQRRRIYSNNPECCKPIGVTDPSEVLPVGLLNAMIRGIHLHEDYPISERPAWTLSKLEEW